MAERTNPHAEIIVGAQDQATPVFDQIKNSVKGMGEEMEKQSRRGGDSFKQLGDPALPAATKVDSATKSIIQSIERATAAMNAGSKGSASYFEELAKQRGVSGDALKPYIASLREAEAAQKAALLGQQGMALSAKQTAAALRGIPAQMTDIVVSLQGGQAPLTVLLQQGGQLKDMFGGIAPAARALGGAVMGLINPFTLAAAAVVGLGVAMTSINGKDAALLALSTQLTGTGRASAAAVGDIKALIKELNLIPGVSKASATAIITEFAKVNGIGGELFKSLGASVADFAAATGTDLPTAAKKLADAFADPAKGAQALEGALGTLTAAQILSIEKMAAMGDKSGAQVAMMDALKQATEGLAKQGMTPLGEATDKMSNAWDALTSSIGNSEAFRTANSWLATLIEKVAELTVGLSQMKPPTWLQYLPVAGPAIGALRMASGTGAGSRSVSGVVGTWDEGGATGSWGPTASETEQQVKAAIAATRGYETQSAAMEKLRGVASQAKDALKELESQNRGGSVEAMRLRDSIAAMNEKLADMGKKGAPKGPAKETISEYDKLIKKLSDELPKAAAEAEAAQMGYNKSQTEFLALAGSPAWASFSNSQRAVVASMFEGKIASEEAGEAAKALSKSYAEAAAERIKTIQSMERAADSLQSQNDALREEIELIGLSTEQQTLVLQQRNDVIILTKEATLSELERQSAITGTQTRVEIALASEIDALKERNALLGAKGVKNAAVDAAKSAADEWQKTSDKINDTLTDALMRGFESGKDFAKNLHDTVINMFNTMVLRPVISAIVNPVAGAVTGMMGLSGSAQGGGNSVMGGIQTASNLNSLYGAGSQALFGGAAGASAASLGYANIVGMAGGDAIGALAAANGMWAGVATGAQAAAQAAIASNAAMAAGTAAALPAGTTAAAAGAGAGAGVASSALAAIPGWGWALAGVATLAALWDDDSGTYHTGGAAQYSGADGLRTSLGPEDKDQFGIGMGWFRRGDQTISAVSAIAQGLGTALDGVAVAFGQKAGYEVATAFADDSSKDGAWGAMRISKDGQELLNWQDTQISHEAPKEFSDGEAGYKEYLAAVAKDTRTVLLDMDLPSWADTMLESIGDAANMEQLSATLQQIGVIQTTFVQLGKTMEGFAGLTDQAFEALMRASGGFESLAANAGTYYENFYSEAEKTAAVTRSVSESLAQVGLAMPATRDEFRALVESQLAMGESGAEAVAALLGVSGAFASVTESAADAQKRVEEERQQQLQQQANAAKSARDSAYRALENAIAREREAIDVQRSLAAESVDTLTGIFETIRSNVRELYSEVGSTAAMQVSQANAFIDNALRTAQTTGYMPDGAALSEAIGTARSGLSSGAYTSQFEADRDRLVLAGKLSALGEITGEQLTTAERQLKYSQEQIEQLDQTLDYWREQIDIASGTYQATLSVAEAIGKLQALMFPDAAKPASASGIATGVTFGGGATPVAEAANGGRVAGGKTEDGYVREFYSGFGSSFSSITDASEVARLDSVAALAQQFSGTGDVAGLISAAKDSGASLGDLATVLGYRYEDVVRAAGSLGIPAFAGGGLHSGGLRVVGERGWEVEATGPARIWNQQQIASAMGGGNSEVVAELRALREENRQQAGEIARLNLRMARVLEKFDGDGMPATREEAVA